MEDNITLKDVYTNTLHFDLHDRGMKDIENEHITVESIDFFLKGKDRILHSEISQIASCGLKPFVKITTEDDMEYTFSIFNKVAIYNVSDSQGLYFMRAYYPLMNFDKEKILSLLEKDNTQNIDPKELRKTYSHNFDLYNKSDNFNFTENGVYILTREGYNEWDYKKIINIEFVDDDYLIVMSSKDSNNYINNDIIFGTEK